MFNIFIKKNKSIGFTLIELIIVVAIIALISAISFVAINPSKRIGEAADSTRFLDVDAIKAAIERATVDNGSVPSSLSGLTENIPYMIVMAGESTSGEINCENLNGAIAKADILGDISASLPKVPLDPNLPDNSTTTGYFLYKKNNNFFVGYCDSYSEYPFVCGLSKVKDVNGLDYSTVEIGNYCWMAENLNVGTLVSGATTQTNNSIIEKYCYSDNEANCTTDGALYQWSEAMQYGASCNGTGEPPNDKCASPVQGICPSGWHIPAHYELVTLERSVCTSASCVTDFPYNTSQTGGRGTNEGNKLKILSKCHLPSSIDNCATSDFEALMAGYRNTGGSFASRGSDAIFWSSTENGASAWRRYLFVNNAVVDRYADNKAYGFAVRCVKD